MLLTYRPTLSSGAMMRTVGRAIRNCPEPHCGGQLLLRHEELERGCWEWSLVCSLCGREFRTQARDDGRTRHAADGGSGAPATRSLPSRLGGVQAPTMRRRSSSLGHSVR